MDNFFELRKKQIIETFADEEKIKTIIEKTIAKVFEDKFSKKYEDFKKICKLTNYKSRREFFLDLKAFVFNTNMLYNPFDKKKINEMAKNCQLPLFFPDKDTESFLDVPNPELSPEKFAPAKLAKLVEKVEINGQISGYKLPNGEKLKDFFNSNKKVLEKKIPENELYFKPTHEAMIFKKEKFEYVARYGHHEKEYPFRLNYMKKVLSRAKESKAIHNYIYSKMNKDNFSEFFFEKQRGCLKDIAKEFLAEIKINDKILKEQIPSSEELNAMQNEINKVKEVFRDMKENDVLNLNTDFELNKFKKFNTKNIMEQVIVYLEAEPELKTLFQPLILKLHGNGDEFRQKYLNLFIKLYEKNMSEILQQEYEKFKSAGVLLTRDGKTPFTLEKKKDEFMDYFDNYIHKATAIDFHKLIMDDVLFAFSYFVLLDLEKILLNFQEAAQMCSDIRPPDLLEKIPNYTKRYNEYGEEILNVYNSFSLCFKNFDDLKETLDFLNEMCYNMGGIYSITRRKIKFPHTKLYLNYQERLNPDYKDSELIEKLSVQYEFNKDMKEKVKDLKKSITNIVEYNEYNVKEYSIDQLAKNTTQDPIKLFYPDDVNTDEIKETQTGLISYFIKLEGLTSRAINGKFNVNLQ